MKKSSYDKIISIGKIVEVSNFLIKSRTNNDVVWETITLDNPRCGWIVGYKTVYDGKWITSCNYSYDYDGDVYFNQIKSHHCVMILFWPTMNPVCVDIKDVNFDHKNITDIISPQKLSWKNVPEHVKKELSEESKTWPRDKRGRWV